MEVGRSSKGETGDIMEDTDGISGLGEIGQGSRKRGWEMGIQGGFIVVFREGDFG